MLGRGGMLRSKLLTAHGRLMPRNFFAWLPLGDGDGCVGLAAHGSALSTLHAQPQLLGDVFIYGAGVGLLLGDAELGQHVDDGVRGDLKLPCELIDSNFTHK